MKKFSFLLICLIVLLAACGEGGSGNQQEFNMQTEKEETEILTEANNQLGFDLLANTEADAAGNLFISPTSLYIALSLAYNGAEGETKTEMDQLLGFGDTDIDVLNESNHALLRSLTEEKEDIDLQIANSLWLNETFTFEENYQERMEEYYQATIEEINVTDQESASKINDWVEAQTNEQIQDIVEAPLNPDLVAMLINTIYFNGNWMYPFDPDLTAPADFHLEDDSAVDVQMMTLSEELSYFETNDFQAVSLPYGEGEMSMQIYLPEENADTGSFQDKFTSENWKEWQDSFSITDGEVFLPKFELEYDTILNDALQGLGMTHAFENHASFNNMVEETDEVWISEVVQKTYLLVDEEGTEAAAATSVGMETTSAPVEESFLMEVNRPFFLFITDEETDTILFTGKIAVPTNPEE